MKTTTFRVLNAQAQQLARQKILNNPEPIKSFILGFPAIKQFNIETTYNWRVFYETLKDEGEELNLLHLKNRRPLSSLRTKKRQRRRSYAILIPVGRTSGEKIRKSKLRTDSSTFHRRALVEPSLGSIFSDNRLKTDYQELCNRYNSSAVRTACAKKLVTAIFYLLRGHHPLILGNSLQHLVRILLVSSKRQAHQKFSRFE